MNLLDENIPLEQRDILEARGIRCRSVGPDIAKLGIGDDNLVALLHRLKQPTFFTRDQHFFKPRLVHASYGLVWLDVAPEEAAFFIRRFLVHPRFKTKLSRRGLVARVHHDGVHFWQRNRRALEFAAWPGA